MCTKWYASAHDASGSFLPTDQHQMRIATEGGSIGDCRGRTGAEPDDGSCCHSRAADVIAAALAIVGEQTTVFDAGCSVSPNHPASSFTN